VKVEEITVEEKEREGAHSFCASMIINTLSLVEASDAGAPRISAMERAWRGCIVFRAQVLSKAIIAEFGIELRKFVYQ
jgi:hypothetical protein